MKSATALAALILAASVAPCFAEGGAAVDALSGWLLGHKAAQLERTDCRHSSSAGVDFDLSCAQKAQPGARDGRVETQVAIFAAREAIPDFARVIVWNGTAYAGYLVYLPALQGDADAAAAVRGHDGVVVVAPEEKTLGPALLQSLRERQALLTLEEVSRAAIAAQGKLEAARQRAAWQRTLSDLVRF